MKKGFLSVNGKHFKFSVVYRGELASREKLYTVKHLVVGA